MEVNANKCESTAGMQLQEFALYLICLTMAVPAYDIAVHAGWEYARSFNCDDWEAREAMQAIMSRSQEACNGADGSKRERCYREALAEQLGLPGEDASACAAGAQADVERCLRKAHDFRFMEAAVGRVPAEV
jgi:hypothetical protein